MTKPDIRVSRVAAIYVRVSTDDQTQGTSLDMQRGLHHLARPGLEVRLYDEGSRTGSNTQRPVFQRLVADIMAGEIAQVIVAEQSRLMRDEFGEDWGAFSRLCFINGIILTTPQGDIDFSNSDDKLLAGLRQMLDARERESILRRTAIGKDDMLRTLPYVTARSHSYGYRLEPITSPAGRIHQMLVVDQQQALVVREIFSRYVGGQGAPVIAKALNEQHVPYFAQKNITSEARTIQRGQQCQWTQATIYRVLDNELLTGLWMWGRNRRSRFTKEREPIIRSHPELQIIERAIFEQAQNIRRQRAAQGPRTVNGKAGVRYPFSGVLKCSECGGSLVRSVRGGTRKREVTWRCKASNDPGLVRSCGSRINLQEEDAHALVWPLVHQYIVLAANEMVEGTRRNHPNVQREQLVGQVAALDLREQHLLDMVETGGASPQLKERFERLVTERSQLLAQIEQVGADGDTERAVAQTMYQLINITPDHLRTLPPGIQNATLVGVFSGFIVEPLAERGKRGKRMYRIKALSTRRYSEEIPAESLYNGGVVFSSSPPRR